MIGTRLCLGSSTASPGAPNATGRRPLAGEREDFHAFMTGVVATLIGMEDFGSRTKMAWDIARDGYFVETLWGVFDDDLRALNYDRVFFKNLIRTDGSMVFLGNYNQSAIGGRIRASTVAHEQLKLVLSLSAPDRMTLRAHPGKKMTVDELRGRRASVPVPSLPGSAAGETSADEGDRIRTPLVSIKRADVVNEATKSALRAYLGRQDADRMREALAVFLTATPNGGSTRLFLRLQNLRADTIEVSPTGTLPDGQPDHTKGYDIVLTCSPLEGR